MLKEFSVKNFLSFKDKTIFTMEADTILVSEHQDHIVNIRHEKLLKVASFYGPNGSGKSNFLKALLFFRNLTTRSHLSVHFNDYQITRDTTAFKFSKEKNSVIELESTFVTADYTIRYDISVDFKGNNTQIVYESCMFSKNDNEYFSLFTRDTQKVILGEQLNQYINMKNVISDQIPLLTFLYTLYVRHESKNVDILEVIKVLVDEISRITYVTSLRNLQSTTNRVEERSLFVTFYENKTNKEKALRIINNLGIRINDIKIEHINENVKIIVYRDVNGVIYPLDLSLESDGTRALLNILPSIIISINRGGILVVDEIDAHLHPKLTKEIIKIFNSENNKGAQLLFTSHDIINMTNDLFRRDEIWFSVKDSQTQSSTLLALTDFVNYKGERVRKDAKYSKQYLEGKYGADPFIEKGVFWHE